MTVAERNRLVIEEFRANEGRIGGAFEGIPVLLMHSVDAAGDVRIVPMTYRPLGEDFLVVASNSGSDSDPAWYADMTARPRVIIEVGLEIVVTLARTAVGADRDRLWAEQKQLIPRFAEYEHMTARQMPVIVMSRV